MADFAAPPLRQLQRQLLGLIRAPHGVEDELARLGLAAPDLECVVAGDPRGSATDRLGIYADMYFLRLLEVLRGAFPRVREVLGDDDFAALATDYLEAHPSRHPSLRHLGDGLAGFLRDPAAPRPHAPELPPFVADLAALEWARYDVFDEADAAPVTLAALQVLPAAVFAQVPVRLVPAHRVVPVEHAIETTWRALGRREAWHAPVLEGRRLLVWRQGTFVYHRPVGPLEGAVLDGARAGTTFGTICEQIAEHLAAPATDAEAPACAAERAFELLARWVSDELLVHVAR